MGGGPDPWGDSGTGWWTMNRAAPNGLAESAYLKNNVYLNPEGQIEIDGPQTKYLRPHAWEIIKISPAGQGGRKVGATGVSPDNRVARSRMKNFPVPAGRSREGLEF